MNRPLPKPVALASLVLSMSCVNPSDLATSDSQALNPAVSQVGTSPATPTYVYTSAFPSLADAVAAASGKTLVVDSAIEVDQNLTLAVARGRIMVEPGGSLSIAPGVSLHIQSPFSAPLIPVFAAPGSHAAVGSVYFRAVEHIYPQWWGAVADGVTDDTDAFQRMFDATFDPTTGSYRAYSFPEGQYLLNGTVSLDPQPHAGHGLQTAPALLGANMGSVTSYLGIGTTFIKDNSGPMFVIGGTYDEGSDLFTLDTAQHVNPKYLTVERIRFTTNVRISGASTDPKPIGILGEIRHARFRDAIFTGLWTGVDTRGYSDYSLYEGCIFDSYHGVVLRDADATLFLRCQFGESFVGSLQTPGPAITMMGGDVKLQSCSMNEYYRTYAIRVLGGGWPVLSIDDLHAEGSLILAANVGPLSPTAGSGSRFTFSSSRVGCAKTEPGKPLITVRHVDELEISHSIFYATQGNKLPSRLLEVAYGTLAINGSSFLEVFSGGGGDVIPGVMKGPEGIVHVF